MNKIQIINREIENEYIYIWGSDDDYSESVTPIYSSESSYYCEDFSHFYYETVNLRESLLSE